MFKTRFLTATAVLALGAAPALAAPPSSSAPTSAPAASQAGAPASAVVTAPAVAVVIDPQTGTAAVIPVNPNADVPPDVTAALKALYATGRIKPGQVTQIVVQRGSQVTQVIANAPH